MKIRVYLAEIRGVDPMFICKRKFLKYKATSKRQSECHYVWEIGGHGVFELSVRYFAYSTGELMCRERMWFVYYKRHLMEISQCDVLLTKFNLDLQYKPVADALRKQVILKRS